MTIPTRIREYLGLKPGSVVEFRHVSDGRIVLMADDGGEKRAKQERDRFELALAALRGSAGPGLSTDEVMRLTRGWGEPDYNVK